MYNPDENDIDRLSREAAEHYRAPGTPAWDALRQTLDKELPPEKEKRRRGFLFFFLMGLGLLVAGSGIWYGTRTHSTAPVISSVDQPADKKQQGSKDNSNKVAENTTIAKNNNTQELTANPTASKNAGAEKTIPASNHSSVNDKNTTKETANKSVPAKTKSAEKLMANNHLLKTTPSAKNIPANNPAAAVVMADHLSKNKLVFYNKQGTVNDNTPPDSKSPNLHKKSGKDPSPLTEVSGDIDPKNKDAKKKAGKSVTGDKIIADDKTDATNDIAAKNNDKDNTKDNSNAQKNNTPTPVPIAEEPTADKTVAPKEAVAAKPVAVNANKDSAKPAAAKIKSKSKNEQAILLGLTAGLDLSTVKFNYSSKVGYNFGLMGGYQFSKHWSVYTGLIYTKKNYKLNGIDYHPPKDYWIAQPGINLEKVEGYCRMWDVPVLGRYTFNPSSKTSFFASAGLSSYFMKKQQYNYTYDTSGWTYTASWSDNKSNNHFFSIVDLSAGFVRPMGKYMNWQVEPYAKIPLGGVGFGNIKLSSFGINLTVQYKHPVKR